MKLKPAKVPAAAPDAFKGLNSKGPTLTATVAPAARGFRFTCGAGAGSSVSRPPHVEPLRALLKCRATEALYFEGRCVYIVPGPGTPARPKPRPKPKPADD